MEEIRYAFTKGDLTYIPPPVLTKREYFAAFAMQGIISNAFLMEKMVKIGPRDDGWVIAKSALQYADALIAELNKETK